MTRQEAEDDIRARMEKACADRDAASARNGAQDARTESREEGKRWGLAYALDLVRKIDGARPSVEQR